MNQKSPLIDASAEVVIGYYSDMVYRLAFARTGTRCDADEIYQEVFLRYIKKAPVFHDEEHRKAWLIRVTVNCSKTLLRSTWRRKTQPLEEGMVFTETEDIELYHELQQLPPKYREVIHLFYYEDLSVREMGLILHRKESTVRTQLTRARAMLRSIIQEGADYV